MGDLKKVVTEETAKQTIIFLFGLLSVVAAAGVLHHVDDWKTFKMGTALAVKRVCQGEADRWQKWADDASTFYNREKL
jgi:hypothetical protein